MPTPTPSHLDLYAALIEVARLAAEEFDYRECQACDGTGTVIPGYDGPVRGTTPCSFQFQGTRCGLPAGHADGHTSEAAILYEDCPSCHGSGEIYLADIARDLLDKLGALDAI